MDLRSGTFYWPAVNEPGRIDPPLVGDVACDIAVIGGGVTGALTAYELARAGRHVIVLDRRRIARGSTAASTALLLYELDVSLTELAGKLGERRAVRAYQVCAEAVSALAALAVELGGCDFRCQPSLYLASSRADADALHDEFDLRRRHGFAVEWLDAAAVRTRFGIERPAALLTPQAAQIDPYRLTLRLIEEAMAHGAQVFADTAVTGYEPEAGRGGGVTLRTAHGHVQAQRAIMAAGYETQQWLCRDLVKLVSSYAIVSQPLHDPLPCLVWETARPYLYARTTADGRVMVGGADEAFSDPAQRDQLIAAKADELRQQFRQLYPQLDVRPEYAWAGTFGETTDGLPYVGTLPEWPGAIFALSYGANGIVFARIAAAIIRDACLGRAHPDAELFGFGRGGAHAAPSA